MKKLVPKRLRAAFASLVAGVDTSAMPLWKRVLIRALRIGIFVIRDLRKGQLDLQAMSLVYTTLLSLVPLLAVSFWVLQALGVHNRMEPVLLRFLEPLGEQGAELTRQLIGSVENVNSGVLGTVGALFLIWSAVSLIQKIERAFGQIWQIAPRRKIAYRIGSYLSVVLIGPVLIFSVLGIITSALDYETVVRLLEVPAVGAIVAAVEGVMHYVLVVVVFALAYKLVPNTWVRLISALIGAAAAGILWETVGWLFASFTVTSARYAAIYSGFAILLLFIIWIYLSWLILLLGASVAFYHQYPQFLGLDQRGLRLSSRLREKLALLVMLHTGRSRRNGEPPWSARRLALRIRAPIDAIWRVLDGLVEKGLLIRSGRSEPVYLPARPLQEIPLWDVLEGARTVDEGGYLNTERIASDVAVDELERSIVGTVDEFLAERTVLDLVLDEASVEEHLGDSANQRAAGNP